MRTFAADQLVDFNAFEKLPIAVTRLSSCSIHYSSKAGRVKSLKADQVWFSRKLVWLRQLPKC